MLNHFDEKKIIKKILENAKTNFIPLNDYEFSEYPSAIPSCPHLRIWRQNLNWKESKNISEPSKICFISDKNKTPCDVYHQIIENNCSLIEDYLENEKRYIIIRPKRIFNCPLYDMKSKGTVLLYCGGGYGDLFNTLRYINLYPQVKFVAEVSDSLFKLVESTNLFYKVIRRGEEFKTDYYITSKDLNYKHKHIGSKLPIFCVDPHPEVNGGIGFCFMGNKIKYTTRRCFNYRILENFKNYKLYNLQIEHPVEFAINIKISDWYDTARIIQNCDIIITPPTAILHLAGIMGKPIIAVFKNEYENLELQYFDKNGSKYYPLRKIYEKDLEGYLNKYVTHKL